MSALDNQTKTDGPIELFVEQKDLIDAWLSIQEALMYVHFIIFLRHMSKKHILFYSTGKYFLSGEHDWMIFSFPILSQFYKQNYLSAVYELFGSHFV